MNSAGKTNSEVISQLLEMVVNQEVITLDDIDEIISTRLIVDEIANANVDFFRSYKRIILHTG